MIFTLTENDWFEVVNPNITPEEQNILKNADKNMDSARQTIESIKNRSKRPASPEEVATLQGLYDQHKIDGAVLVNVTISLPGGGGMINCRVGDDHRQIRF